MDGSPIWQACTGLLGTTAGRNPTWAGPLVVKKPWENSFEGGISPQGGAGCWGTASPDVRHTMQGSLTHAGHVRAMIPEAQVKVLFAGPAVILVGHWIRGGEGLAPNKGMV